MSGVKGRSGRKKEEQGVRVMVPASLLDRVKGMIRQHKKRAKRERLAALGQMSLFPREKKEKK